MFLEKSKCQLSNIVKELQVVGLYIEDQGHVVDYVSINILKHDDGSFEFTQCSLIDSIIEDEGLSYAKATTKLMLSKRHSMLSKIPLTLTMISITAQLFAYSTTLPRQHGQT